MELKEYIKIIKNNLKLIFVIALITSFSAFLFSSLQPIKYETSLSLLLNKDRSQLTDDFKYDGYYALEASGILADSIVQWTKSPELVSSVYQKAQIDGKFKNLKSYTKKIIAKKMSPQYIEVKFETNNIDQANKISIAIIDEINGKIQKMKNDSEGEIAFLISNENPITIKKEQNIFLNSIVGLISGIMLGIFLVFFRRYFKTDPL